MSWNEVVLDVIGADRVPRWVLSEGVDKADDDKLDTERKDPEDDESRRQPERAWHLPQAGNEQEGERDDAPDDPLDPEGHAQGPPGMTRLRAERSAGTLPHRTVMSSAPTKKRSTKRLTTMKPRNHFLVSSASSTFPKRSAHNASSVTRAVP